MALLQPTDVTAVEVGFSALWSRYDYLCASIPDAKKKLGRDFVELGGIVNDVREHQLWGARGYQTIGAFVEATGEKVGLKRGQIYDAAATVRLLPSVSKTDMLELGIVRASALKNLAKATGVQPSTEMIAWAKANKSEVVKDEIYTKIHGEPPEGQDYFTINYVATPGQQLSIENMFSLAEKMGSFPVNLPEHSKTAAILELASQECASSWSAASPKQGYGMAALLFQAAYKSFCKFNESAEDIAAFEKELHAAFNIILSGGTYEGQVV